MFFGFTQCPDACPTTVSALAEAMKLLGPEADRVQVLFVTVDPARDTPALQPGKTPGSYTVDHSTGTNIYAIKTAMPAVADQGKANPRDQMADGLPANQPVC